MAERVDGLLHRDFGPRSFDNSHSRVANTQKPYHIDDGRIPAAVDKTELLERFRRRLSPETAQSIPERFTDIELGSSDWENPLPISEYKDVITKTIQQNPVTIIVAETGAGKSTQVPQYLLEAGHTVTMTQPRRLAANMLSERIGDEIVEAFGDPDQRKLVGLHTAERNTITEHTRISVLTDGLRLVQELNEREDVENEVLIIDEVHEWNKNIEILVAWTKKVIRDKPNLRVVLMSATMDAHRLADYFADVVERPPIIEVPGRTHHVEKTEDPDSNVYELAMLHSKLGKNVLAFLPGVREVDDTKRDLEESFEIDGIDDITTLPLHGKLSEQEQKAVDREYPGAKVISSTNVAQTSLTIADIDIVIDSGLERRVEIDEEGVQSLRLHAISRADADQRAGRAGRTHAGEYILTRLNNDAYHVPYIQREEYPTPEIQRSDVDRNTLEIAGTGLDLSELDLFHPVDRDILLQSRHRMQLLGALDDEGRITARGRRMNKFPVHPNSSRMLIESDNYSDEIRAYVSAIVSSIEVGKLPSFLYNANRNWRDLTEEKQSDHLAQLDIFIAIQDMNSPYELKSLGLDVRNVTRARELHDKLTRRAGMKPQPLQPPTEEQRAEILECVAAGLVDFVYVAAGDGTFIRAVGNHATPRSISNRSTVTNGSPNVVVGTPYQYEHPKTGEKHVIENVSVITARTLGAVAQNLCEWEEHGTIHWRGGQPVREARQVFRGEIPTGNWREEDAQPSPELRAAVIQYALEHPGSAQQSLRDIKKELEMLRRKGGDVVPQLTHDDLERFVCRAAPQDITDPSLVDEYLRRIMVSEGITLDNFVSPEEQFRIYENSPATIERDGIELRLLYSNGKAKTNIELHQAAALEEEIHLPDGRHVQLVYRKKAHTLEQLKQMTIRTT